MFSSVVSEGEFYVVIPKDFFVFFHSGAAWAMLPSLHSEFMLIRGGALFFSAPDGCCWQR